MPDEGEARVGLKPMKKKGKKVSFAICIANKECDDLELSKVYRVLPDAKAAGMGCLRVIDESGEDYLYPDNLFIVLPLPETVRGRLVALLNAA